MATSQNGLTRRDLVKTGAALGAGILVSPSFAARTVRSSSEQIRVGVIGCGGRGTGAAINALAAHPATCIVALADLFEDRLNGSLSHLRSREDAESRVKIDPAHTFAGFDAYKKLLAIKEIDYVILATPPHFRPIHFDAAINAGKNVFMEKPVAVDPHGVRMVIDAGERARAQKLSVVAGTQRRHERSYLALMERIQSGEIGDVVAAQCYWNQGGLWVHERKPEYSDMEWQCRNWLYFCWLSGDHICEQHIHNLDVVNWAKGGPPVKATGMGGRQVRTEDKYGNIFDHFAIEYEYADGSSLMSMCRQIDGCAGRVEEVLRGSKGTSVSRPGFAVLNGANEWRFSEKNGNPYDDEHHDLIASITGEGSYLNEAKRVAESTLTAIMGRMSTYTGKQVTWEQAMKSELNLAPDTYSFSDLKTDPVPTPGRTPLI
ncbi:MAG: Gfo/Idh/MocA family oxidoreductase [Phycisphaeraceae bacterium]|nr:Gfo/Idh/MocA family oxidoreductase [Phycisphaerales bacterium]MCB9861517.1 Gfo/Idh/MocA family oxidoreductase [Phycisphaeraceae bacterium]